MDFTTPLRQHSRLLGKGGGQSPPIGHLSARGLRTPISPGMFHPPRASTTSWDFSTLCSQHSRALSAVWKGAQHGGEGSALISFPPWVSLLELDSSPAAGGQVPQHRGTMHSEWRKRRCSAGGRGTVTWGMQRTTVVCVSWQITHMKL